MYLMRDIFIVLYHELYEEGIILYEIKMLRYSFFAKHKFRKSII